MPYATGLNFMDILDRSMSSARRISSPEGEFTVISSPSEVLRRRRCVHAQGIARYPIYQQVDSFEMLFLLGILKVFNRGDDGGRK